MAEHEEETAAESSLMEQIMEPRGFFVVVGFGQREDLGTLRRRRRQGEDIPRLRPGEGRPPYIGRREAYGSSFCCPHFMILPIIYALFFSKKKNKKIPSV